MKDSQIIRFWGLKYTRIVTDKIDFSIEDLRDKFDYVVIYSYQLIPGAEKQKIAVIDLGKSAEEIYNNFWHGTKKEIKKTHKLLNKYGREKFSMKITKDHNESYAFYKKIKKLNGVRPDVKKDFTDCLFFNAYWNGSLLVSNSYYAMNGIFRGKHLVSFSKQKDLRKINAYANKRLKWEAIQYAKKNGFKTFDLTGIRDDLRGIKNFKMSFGGEIATCYIYRHKTLKFKIYNKVLQFFGKNIH